MTEREFKHNMAVGNAMRHLAGPLERYFWQGYLRGIQRHYHGEKFVTEDEHRLWMGPADQMNEPRRLRGIGYQTGTQGMPVSEAINHFKSIK